MEANGNLLRSYRRRKKVSQAELARELGFATPNAIHRREVPERHPEHVPMSNAEVLHAAAAIERIVERRQQATTPADILPAAR